MIGGAAWALIVAAALGAVLVAALGAPGARSPRGSMAVVFLGLGIGLAVTGQLYFLATAWFPGKRLAVSVAAEAVLLAAAWMTALFRARRSASVAAAAPPPPAISLPTFLLSTLFVQMAVAALIAGARLARAEPEGAWDGWAIWNMHARFLWRAPREWAALLRQPSIAWSHPDYPPAVPAAVARLWSWIGSGPGWAGGAISLLYGAAAAGVLVTALARVRGAAVASLAGIVLLGTPPFLAAAASQQADLPLGFFLLAGSVLLLQAELPGIEGENAGGLAGLCAGLATGVKNEGWLVALVLAGGWALRAKRRSGRGGAFWTALAVALVPTLIFKGQFAPNNDLVASQPWHRWPGIFDPSRWRLIFGALEQNLVPAATVLILIAAAALLGRAGQAAREGPSPWPAGAVVAAMLAGYCLIYLVTPYDLSWHLRNSLDRLLLQLWPATLWFAGLLIPRPGVPAAAPRRRCTRRLWVLGNGLLAAGLLFGFSRQRAANEFAMSWQGGNRISAVLQQGWFGAEENRRNRWAWSSGDGIVDIVAPRGESSVTVAFALRSLSPRRVVVRWREETVWQGQVGTDYVHVSLPPLPFASGELRLHFASFGASVLEGPRSDARRLAFAVYNMKL
jgi:hypothetical protein